MLSKADKEFLIELINNKSNINRDDNIEENEPTKEDLYEALEMACQELRNEEQGKTNARFKLQKLKNDLFVGGEMSYEEFFIDQVLRKKKEEREDK